MKIKFKTSGKNLNYSINQIKKKNNKGYINIQFLLRQSIIFALSFIWNKLIENKIIKF